MVLKSRFVTLFLLLATVCFSQDRGKSVTPKNEREKGYCGWVEAGILLLPEWYWPNGDRLVLPSLRVFNGARISHWVTLGGEIGFDAYCQATADAKVRVNITKKRVSPFFDFSAGYSYLFDNVHGFNLSPTVGFKVWGKKRQGAFTLRAGYYGIGSVYIVGYDGPVKINQRIFEFCHALHIMAGAEF